MTPKDLAALLHGREYGNEITPAEEVQAKAAGLVVVFGYSDDNVELRGAIHEEVGAYDGTTLRITPSGLLEPWPEDPNAEAFTEAEAETYFRRKAEGVQPIEAVWCPKETEADTEPFASWAFKTSIPHETFDVMEDGELFCRGIVFALADVKGNAPTFDLIEHLYRQIEFSAHTYGPGDRTAGVCDHIRKELNEVQDDAAAGVPTLPEWVDVIILGFDGAWRSGATPEQIAAAIVAKQTKNEGRKWPDWRTAEPGKAIEHDRSGELA